MKKNWCILIGIAGIVIVTLLVWNKMAHKPAPEAGPVPAQEGVSNLSHSNVPVAAEKLRPLPGTLTKRPSDFTEAEMEDFTNLFATKLKPAAEKWFSVYSNRAPFNLSDLTPDKFVSQLGRDALKHRAYTFVMGDITFGIQTFRGATYVNYLASRQGLTAMTTMPKLASAPDLSMPVTREQVIDLVEADSSIRFPANEVTLKPTGESGSLMGGVDAEVGKEVNNPLYTEYSTTSMDFSMVFGPDGKLAYYQRTP